MLTGHRTACSMSCFCLNPIIIIVIHWSFINAIFYCYKNNLTTNFLISAILAIYIWNLNWLDMKCWHVYLKHSWISYTYTLFLPFPPLSVSLSFLPFLSTTQFPPHSLLSLSLFPVICDRIRKSFCFLPARTNTVPSQMIQGRCFWPGLPFDRRSLRSTWLMRPCHEIGIKQDNKKEIKIRTAFSAVNKNSLSPYLVFPFMWPPIFLCGNSRDNKGLGFFCHANNVKAKR